MALTGLTDWWGEKKKKYCWNTSVVDLSSQSRWSDWYHAGLPAMKARKQKYMKQLSQTWP